MSKYKKLTKALLPLMIAGMLLGNVASSALAVELPSGYQAESSVVDLGWTTHANSSKTINVYKTFNNTTSMMMDNNMYMRSIEHIFNLTNSWSFNFNAGAFLPVNLTIAYPSTVEPGSEAVIYIGVERLPGYVYFNLSGHHELNLYNFFNATMDRNGDLVQHLFEMTLTVTNDYSVGWNLSVKTPIGNVSKTYNHVVARLGTFNLDMFINHTRIAPWGNVTNTGSFSVSFNVSLIFDVTLVAETLVIGNVTVSGTALDSNVEKTLIWSSEGVKSVTVGVSQNATENDTLTTDVSLGYKVKVLKVFFKNVSLKVHVNEDEVLNGFGKFIDSVTSDWNKEARNRFKYRLSHMLQNILENFVMKPIPLPIKRGKTEVRHKPERPKAGEENTLESGISSTTLLLLVTDVTIAVGEVVSGGFKLGRFGYILIIAAVFVGIIALVYSVRRGNNKY